MVVHDRSELKRRVRAAVKRAAAADLYAPVDWAAGPWGVQAMLRTWMTEKTQDEAELDELFQLRCVQNLPLEAEAAETFAALAAMDMPMMDLRVVREREKLLGREGYAQLAIERAGVERAFTPVLLKDAEETLPALAPFAPGVEAMLWLKSDDAPPERYGTQYSSCAIRAQEIMTRHAVRTVYDRLTGGEGDAAMLRYCVAPLAEENGAVLHLRGSAQDMRLVRKLAEDFKGLRLIVDLACDGASLEAAGQDERILPCVSLDGLETALKRRGTHLALYGSGAGQPGQLIGRWQNARARIAQALTQALLPLARTGFALQGEDIDKHAKALLGGSVLALYK